MIVWLDAQLPPGLADWLRVEFRVEAQAVRTLAMRDASDRAIFEAARLAGATVISKDADFVDLVQRFGPPPQLIWLTCGNVSNTHLRAIFSATFPQACTILESGQSIVEIGDLEVGR